ncbi:MAG: DDE-type integrase/transposase/recombinase [Pseudomonadota bacterium]
MIDSVLALHREWGSLRKTADAFNRIHAHNGWTVCKSTVHHWLHQHTKEARAVRHRTRNRVPLFVPPNHCWGVDGTGKRDEAGTAHFILGIVDHGTRRLLKLAVLAPATSQTVLAQLHEAIGLFGKPDMIRTDNGSVFTSEAFCADLAAAGIRHKRSDFAKPWQNARIERLFGTLKEKLNQILVADSVALGARLDEFSFWYNVVRPNQHLFGLTPMEAWRGVDPYRSAPKAVRRYSAWNGVLHGVLIVH